MAQEPAQFIHGARFLLQSLSALPGLEKISTPFLLVAAAGFLGPDLTNASVTITYPDGATRILPADTLSTGRTLTLGTQSAFKNAVIRVVRRDTNPFTYTVRNGGPAGGVVFVFPAAQEWYAEFQFNGTDFVLVGGGALSLTDTLADIELDDCFCQNGQSNTANGQAAPMRGVSSTSVLLGPDLLGFSETAQSFVTLIDGSANSKSYTSVPIATGPGAGKWGTRLMRLLANLTGKSVRSIALAFTAQGILYFRKNSATKAWFDDGTQHATLNNYNLMLSYITIAKALGFPPKRYIFGQGEANAGNTEAAYYSEIRGFFDEFQTDVTAILGHELPWLIIPTIGDSLFDGPVNSVSGVRSAQLKLAAEESKLIKVVPNLDFRNSTAKYRHPHYDEFSGEQGSEELANRLFVSMQGSTPRPEVKEVAHIKDAYAWTWNWYNNRTIISSSGLRMSQWIDDAAVVLVPASGSGSIHTPSDTAGGTRSSIELLPAGNEHYTIASVTGSNIWSFMATARLDSLLSDGVNVWLFQVEPAGGGNRVGLDLVTPAYASTPSVFVEGNGNVQFTGANVPFLFDGVTRTYGFVYDGPAGTAKLYISGQLVSTVSGLNNHTLNPARIRIGAFSGVQSWKGKLWNAVAKAGGPAPTDAQMLGSHLFNEQEFRLST